MLKDKKIRIQRKVTIGSGVHKTEAWVDLGNSADTDPPHYLWAYYRHMSEKEISSTTIQAYAVDVMFIINWRSDVCVGQRVIYKGVIYNIINADDYEGRKQDLKIYAKAVV